MSSVCSNASSKTWTPLPDRFIDEHLVEMFPLFAAVVTSGVRRHDSGCDTHAPASSPKSGSLPGSRSGLFAPYPFCCLSTLTKHDCPRKIPCLLFTLTVDCVNITSLPDKWMHPLRHEPSPGYRLIRIEPEHMYHHAGVALSLSDVCASVSKFSRHHFSACYSLEGNRLER